MWTRRALNNSCVNTTGPDFKKIVQSTFSIALAGRRHGGPSAAGACCSDGRVIHKSVLGS